MHLKMSPVKWPPFLLGLNVLMSVIQTSMLWCSTWKSPSVLMSSENPLALILHQKSKMQSRSCLAHVSIIANIKEKNPLISRTWIPKKFPFEHPILVVRLHMFCDDDTRPSVYSTYPTQVGFSQTAKAQCLWPMNKLSSSIVLLNLLEYWRWNRNIPVNRVNTMAADALAT